MSSLLPAKPSRGPSRTPLPLSPDNTRTPPGSSGGGSAKSRTSHACDRCRLMRTKCSGGQRCTKCVKDNAACMYGDRKRERNKKDLAESVERVGSLEEDNQILLTVLRGILISPHLSAEEHEKISEVLTRVSAVDPTDSERSNSQSHSQPSGTARVASHLRDGQTGEQTASSARASPRREGVLSRVVDLDRGRGASGFLGKMSETSWIQRVREYLYNPDTMIGIELPTAGLDQHLVRAQELTYFMDDTNLLQVDEDHFHGNELPPLTTGLLLSEAFFHAVQGVFQFLDREMFIERFVIISQAQTMPTWSERPWLGVANVVWAIGAKWLHMTKLYNEQVTESHLMYFARARALGLDHRVMFDHPDIERLQGIGLLAFYLMVNGSLARAYGVLGHALRLATALGLHLIVRDPTIGPDERLRRAQTWYSLFNLEVLVSEMLARPKAISVSDITVSINILERLPEAEQGFTAAAESRRIWIDFLSAHQDHVQRMTGGVVPWRSFAAVGKSVSKLHFSQHTRLCLIGADIAQQLYTGLQIRSWAETQLKIGELQSKLREWGDSLPEELSIQSTTPSASDPRAKIELATYFHSLEMILYRPCLGELRIPNESQRSQEFNRSSARACVHAAMAMMAIIPDNPTAHEAYQLLPWWALLHYVCQATAILFLELCLEAQHFPNEVDGLVNSVRKCMAYLWCMAGESLSAYKAWRIFRYLLTDIAERYQDLNIADIPEISPQPPEWNELDEHTLQQALQPSARSVEDTPLPE